MLRVFALSLCLVGVATQLCRKSAPSIALKKKKAVGRSHSKSRSRLRRKRSKSSVASRCTASPSLSTSGPPVRASVTRDRKSKSLLSLSGRAAVSATAAAVESSNTPASHRAASSTAPSPSALPLSKEQLLLATPRTLYTRLRSLLVQLVLLSPEPLKPSQIFAIYREVVDAETAALFACAAHAVQLCTSEPFHRTTGRPLSHHSSKDNRRTSESSEHHHQGEGAVAGGDAAASSTGSREELIKIGQAFLAAYRGSIHPLVAALHHNAHEQHVRASADGVAWGKQEKRGSSSERPVVPAAKDVVQWMLLHILFCDPEFRVSAYGGTVCYPALPSLLLATAHRMQDSERLKQCYALQWDASSFSAAADSGPPSSTSDVRWLNGAAGSPPWTMAHALYAIYDIHHARKSSNSTTAAATETTETATAEGREKAPTMVAAVAPMSNSSGHRLVDYFICQAASTLCPDGAAAAMELGSDKAAAKAFPSMGWNEGTQGSCMLQQYVAGFADVYGPLSFHMEQNATRRQPSGEFYHSNVRLMPDLFRSLVPVPISVARLSTLLRWNLSIHLAGVFRSFFYYLLVMGANPTVHRLTRGVQQRIAATAYCADLFGGQGHGSRGRHRRGGEKDRAAVEQQVRQALLLEHDAAVTAAAATTTTLKGDAAQSPPTSFPSASFQAALRDAFAREGEVVHHPPLTDDRVVELLCLRVLPHARPGCAPTQQQKQHPRASAVASTVVPSSFRGYPLTYIEVLPTWSCTPEETLKRLRAKYLRERAGEEARTNAQIGVTTLSGAGWLEKSEEPYILVYAMNSPAACGRLRVVAERFASVVTSGAMTLRRLSVITLWAHEYGVEMAAEMLFVVLLLNPQSARLHPPAPAHAESASVAARRSYGDWTVEFI